MTKRKPKSTALGQYTKQLTFWDTLASSQYSHTIELYTAIPQYVWSRQRRENDKYLPILKRSFEHRGIAYTVEITPARVINHEGVEKEYYPGQREELVEETLRKLMCERQGGYINDKVAVHFSLYQLENELKRTGHTYNKNEIKEALDICNKTSINVKSADGKFSLSFHPIEMIGVITPEEGAQERAGVIWNALVANSISTGTFRQINYEKIMSWRSVISRQLHKRLAHNYTQASILKKFEILLSTLIRDFGLTAYPRLSDNLREVEKALKEMQQQEVLSSFEITKIYDTKRRNKMIDAKLTLITGTRFNKEVIDANRQQDQVRKQLTLPVENSNFSRRQ
jgi:hypothetical protein